MRQIKNILSFIRSELGLIRIVASLYSIYVRVCMCSGHLFLLLRGDVYFFLARVVFGVSQLGYSCIVASLYNWHSLALGVLSLVWYRISWYDFSIGLFTLSGLGQFVILLLLYSICGPGWGVLRAFVSSIVRGFIYSMLAYISRVGLSFWYYFFSGRDKCVLAGTQYAVFCQGYICGCLYFFLSIVGSFYCFTPLPIFFSSYVFLTGVNTYRQYIQYMFWMRAGFYLFILREDI